MYGSDEGNACVGAASDNIDGNKKSSPTEMQF